MYTSTYLFAYIATTYLNYTLSVSITCTTKLMDETRGPKINEYKCMNILILFLIDFNIKIISLSLQPFVVGDNKYYNI